MSCTIHHGDCLDVLKTMDENSVDSIVTDPPYGLSFMGKAWDHSVPSAEVWNECLRVLKPGGHLLAFAGTRTQHRMAVNIEDAGFEIRDMIAWVYGSGFPKSLNVGKAIDKRGGSQAEFAAFRDDVKAAMSRNGISRKELEAALGNFMLSHYLTAASQPAVPNLRDYLIIRDAVCLGDKWDSQFNAEAEREVVGRSPHGYGANTGASLTHNMKAHPDITAPATPEAQQWDGWGTALKPALEPITVARKPFKGTVANNVLTHGTGAINVDGCRVGTEEETRRQKGGWQEDGYVGGEYDNEKYDAFKARPHQGRWPANLIHDGSDEVVGLFPVTGASKATSRGLQLSGRHGGLADIGGNIKDGTDTVRGHDDNGGSAARFFYCAKASKKDRDEGLEIFEKKQTGIYAQDEWSKKNMGNTPDAVRDGRANNHPTVKPTDLMRYLVRLVTPPNGTVLDPFMGSGSTGKGATLEGFHFIGIELDADYIEIARARIDAVDPDNVLS